MLLNEEYRLCTFPASKANVFSIDCKIAQSQTSLLCVTIDEFSYFYCGGAINFRRDSRCFVFSHGATSRIHAK